MSSTANSAKTAPGRPFQKGKSGNPNGRPKVAEAMRARCRKAVDDLVIDAWIAEVQEHGPDWLRAAEHLAAYGYDKPAAAKDDNDALRESGSAWPLSREETLALAKGEP